MEYPYPTLEEILTIIKDNYDSKILLPEFQRSFVWTNQNIKDLLVSLLNGYFIGTFLFLRRGDSFDFAIRYFEGVDRVNPKLPTQPNEANVDKVVLDGQQRLTALFYVLFHPPGINPKGSYYPHRYFIRVNDKLNDEEWDDVILSISENDRVHNMQFDLGDGIKKYSFKEILEWAGTYSDLLIKDAFKTYCFENGLVPFSFLKKREELDDWLEDLGDYLTKNGMSYDEVKTKKKNLKGIFKNWFCYNVPALTLENKPFYEVAEIFERINRTGIALSVFALATAVYFKQGINLRHWWTEYYQDEETAVNKFCDLEDENYPKYVLQIMALLQEKEVKKKVLINPKKFTVDLDKWNRACILLNSCLERIQNTQTGYGVIRPDLLPYKPIIVTSSALLSNCNTDNEYRKLDAWYWASVLTGRYAGASDTVIKQDYDQVKQWIADDSHIPDVIREVELKLTEINLKSITRGALYKAILNIIALHGARDFMSGQSIELMELNDHHIFPKKSGLRLTDENSILNRTLIKDSTNKKIWKKKPSEYLKEMETELKTKERMKDVFQTHLIDNDCLNALMKDEYDTFLEARNVLLTLEMKKRIAI